MPLRSAATAIATVALASLAPPAAEATATARVVQGPLGYTLVDLAPNDGIAPALSFQPAPGIDAHPEQATILHSIGGIWTIDDKDGDGSGALSLDWSGLARSGSVRIAGAAAPGSLLLDAQASSALPDGVFGRTEAYASSAWMSFVLSPHTAVRVSSSAQASGSVDGGDPGVYEYARAQSELNAMLRFADGAVAFYGDGRQSEASSAAGDASGFDEGQLFDLTFGNDSGATASGYLYADAFVWTYATSQVSSVPEPGAAWLLAPGVLILGLRSRRRLRPRGAPTRARPG